MSLKSGVCPFCSSTEIYSNRNTEVRCERGQFLAGTFGTWVKIDTYVCMNCGRFEEFFNDKDFKAEKVREKILKNWEKID